MRLWRTKKKALDTAANEAKDLEKATREEIKLLINSINQISSQHREIRQSQLGEMEKAKLMISHENSQGDKLISEIELERKQRAIAVCAAKKIKSIMDEHQLEINSLKEKHREEKRLIEIRLAQETQKAVMLEDQLKSQRADEKQLAEQIQLSMQKQCLQAIKIISGTEVGYNKSSLQQSDRD